jgi:hypothetical protein
MVRNVEIFPPVTMGHIRGHGCRDLLVYCGSGRCHHSASISGDCGPQGLTRLARDRPSGLIAEM